MWVKLLGDPVDFQKCQGSGDRGALVAIKKWLVLHDMKSIGGSNFIEIALPKENVAGLCRCRLSRAPFVRVGDGVQGRPPKGRFGDGQVVVITFDDGVRFEILPVFDNKDSDSWTYPNANGGGEWRVCNPRAEMKALAKRSVDTRADQRA